MTDVAGWIAPIATMLAAMMTAANLGARITGWGFIVFTVGSLCWIAVGFASGQTNLLLTNAFLTVVNLVGIWRWLGRQRAYEDGGKAAARASRKSNAPNLFTATGLAGMPVEAGDGSVVGRAVEALLECRSATISYIVVATGKFGGVSEQLRAVPRDAIAPHGDRLVLDMPHSAFEALPLLDDGDWPALAPESGAAAPRKDEPQKPVAEQSPLAG